VFELGTFAAAYERNRATAAGNVLDADLVATAVERFMDEHEHKKWEGRITELLPLLTDVLDETQRVSKQWPKATNMLTGKLLRAAGSLRRIGVKVEVYQDTTSRRSMVNITCAVCLDKALRTLRKALILSP
jgi:hypothetical protein